MAEEVKLPQLGESVTEGTITAWLVEEGAEVSEDQPLFEISTDKIDTEVPSPASGVLKEIRAQVDDTIEVGEVVAIIDTDGQAAADDEEAAADDEGGAPDEGADETQEAEETEEVEEPAPEAEAEPEEEAPAAEAEEESTEPQREAAADGADGNGEAVVTSPIVRKLIREHDLDPDRIEGSGRGGRITREDVEKVIAGGGGAADIRQAERPAAAGDGRQAKAAPAARKPHRAEGRSRTEQLPRVRKAIAKGMWESLQTTAQLTAVVEVDVTQIMKLRDRVKRDFEEREGVSLSPFPFFARAVCMVLPRHESLNAAIDTDEGTATFSDFVNLGVAVDAPQGLIVPNVKNADDLTIGALARAIADVADRTRNRKLNPDEVSGATFTLTNTGSRGVMMDTPILNPPEVGILATTKIEKRPVVVTDDHGDDAIAIRWMTYLCLTYDHRMVDGADAARFLTDLKEVLETHDFGPEVGA